VQGHQPATASQFEHEEAVTLVKVNTKICRTPDDSANPDCTHLTEWIGSIHRLSAPAPCSVKGASTLPVVPSSNGEGVLFRQTQTDCSGILMLLKTYETPTFTPTLCVVS
jgi:hypothetical protein